MSDGIFENNSEDSTKYHSLRITVLLKFLENAKVGIEICLIAMKKLQFSIVSVETKLTETIEYP